MAIGGSRTVTPNRQTPEQIRIAGLRALHESLGLVGMIRFLHQYERCSGDYSKDRHEWLDRWALDDIRRELLAQRAASTGDES
jgi:hypothetical protein